MAFAWQIHKRWLPDAIAQMKFSPRKLTNDIENLIKVRRCSGRDRRCQRFAIVEDSYGDWPGWSRLLALQRGAAIASERLSLHPEELMVSEAIVNTGPRRRYAWIQGRGASRRASRNNGLAEIELKFLTVVCLLRLSWTAGRTGIATKRYSHLVIRVKAVDFDQEIERARDPRTRQMWIQRKEMAEAHRQAREQMAALKAQAKKSSSKN